MERDIEELLPHRRPFVFVDKILSINAESITTLKTFKGEEEYFKGHFPGNPVVPGVLLIEVMAQTAGLLASGIFSGGDMEKSAGTVFYLSRVIDVKFRRPIVPPKTVKTSATVIGAFGDAVKVTVQIEAEGETAAEGELVLSKIDINKERGVV